MSVKGGDEHTSLKGSLKGTWGQCRRSAWSTAVSLLSRAQVQSQEEINMRRQQIISERLLCASCRANDVTCILSLNLQSVVNYPQSTDESCEAQSS